MPPVAVSANTHDIFWSLDGTMRFILSIVVVLGIALTGFSTFQIRAVRDYRTNVKEVQSILTAEGKKQVADAHRNGAVFTGQTLDDVLNPKLDGIDALERGWFVVALAGIAIFVVGVAGIIRSRGLSSNKSRGCVKSVGVNFGND